MDSIGKRILHGFFGMIVGAGAGWYLGLPDNILILAVIGAILGAVLAFFLTDKFWEDFKDFF